VSYEREGENTINGLFFWSPKEEQKYNIFIENIKSNETDDRVEDRETIIVFTENYMNNKNKSIDKL